MLVALEPISFNRAIFGGAPVPACRTVSEEAPVHFDFRLESFDVAVDEIKQALLGPRGFPRLEDQRPSLPHAIQKRFGSEGYSTRT